MFGARMAILAVVLAGWTGVPARGNLAPNGDGAEATDGKVVGWNTRADGLETQANGTQIGRIEEPAGSGHYFLRLTAPGKGTSEHAMLSTGQYRIPAGFAYLLTFQLRGSGLQPESSDRSRYAMAYVDFFCDKTGLAKSTIKNERVRVFSNSPEWVSAQLAVMVPPETDFVQIRPQLANKIPGNAAVADFRDFRLLPVDFELPNGGFESGAAPWQAFDRAKCAIVEQPVRSGGKAAQVQDAPPDAFSGWSQLVPVREDRAYVFKGFAKGGQLKANGFIGGAALCLQFLDAQGQPVGEPHVSPAVPGNSEWTPIATPAAQPPATAFAARLTCGMQYCEGSAWFDDLALVMTPREAVPAVRIVRPEAQAATIAAVALPNLLKNGSVEEGSGDAPAGWTYHGKAAPDWTEAELKALHGNGRPRFDIGRGRGEWSRTVTYEGRGALVNVAIDPPLSTRQQWYGRSPVDGYWQSDAMPCEPGCAYLAGAWIKPGAPIGSPWFGPLHLVFTDARGREVQPAPGVRSLLPDAPANEWTYWFSAPYMAPPGAATMRLRFAQEFAAGSGGWGRSLADNLAVWQLPPAADLKAARECASVAEARAWFAATHATAKPPCLPAPLVSPEHECAWGALLNAVPGNLYFDPGAAATLRFALYNPLPVDRRLSLRLLRTDRRGNAAPEIVTTPVAIAAFAWVEFELTLPPTAAFGAFHLDCDIFENGAKAGFFSGRYAVLPRLERPRRSENVWAVTLLSKVYNDGRPRERELGRLLTLAGFGRAWVREGHGDLAEGTVDFYNSLGIKPVLQLHPALEWKPSEDRRVDPAPYVAYGRAIAAKYRGKVAAYGDWGIEQSNCRTAAAPTYRPIKDGKFMSDNEYDHIYLAVREGLAAVDPDTPILIGNIATDAENAAIKRMYGEPVKGRFDGAILNAYMGILTVATNSLATFDKHGDTAKTVWQEETADQRSPNAGTARRYGEGDGADNLVRTWLTMACKCSPRLKAMTQWGFAGEGDIFMVNSALQPRPQFVAHAIMADTLADARFLGDRSTSDLAIFEFERSQDRLFVLWSLAGEREIAFDLDGAGLLKALGLSTPALTVMDVMGNCRKVQARHGVASVKAGTSPVYVFAAPPLTISRKLELSLNHATVKRREPRLALTIGNNTATAQVVSVSFSGQVAQDAARQVTVAPGARETVTVKVLQEPDEGRQASFGAQCRTAGGAVFSTAKSQNFATAARVQTPPPLDGTWAAWQHAQIIAFGESFQVVPPRVAGESYRGKDDIQGRLRLLWDENCLYLGVEALDDVFMPQPERGGSGFMGDSIEFAIQPQGARTPDAKFHEFEAYLSGRQAPWAASRRAPGPWAMIAAADGWKGIVLPTGHRGDVNYQFAIPWRALGIERPRPATSFTMALVLNDSDAGKFAGGRKRIKWFDGIDSAKSPEKFGDVILVEP